MKEIECSWCGKKLNEEENESPRRDEDGDVMCDECYHDEYEITCPICGEYFDKRRKAENTFFVLTSSNEDLKQGIYRVLRFPYYTDDLLHQSIIKGNVEFVKNFTNDKSGEICGGCAKGGGI